MLKLTNRDVVAIGITPRINDVERDRIQEILDGSHPMSSTRKQYDTGTKRKVILDQSPAGPNETADGDDRTSHTNVGSGYDAGPPDDETGPGFTPKRDHEQTFMDHSLSELAFKSDFDTSSRWSPLNFESNKRDAIVRNLGEVYAQPLHRRIPVDKKRSWHKSY